MFDAMLSNLVCKNAPAKRLMKKRQLYFCPTCDKIMESAVRFTEIIKVCKCGKIGNYAAVSYNFYFRRLLKGEM